jgi:hypothetical protein
MLRLRRGLSRFNPGCVKTLRPKSDVSPWRSGNSVQNSMVGLFELRAVGFIDILGFKPLIDRAEASPAGFQELVGIKTVLDAHVRFDNAAASADVPEEVKPRYVFISDSLIVSAPLCHGNKKVANGLAIVIVKTIQIAQKIMQMGHLIRGGISVGNVWHQDQNIFGSGYIDAFETEQRAVHPRVMLSKNAAAEILNDPDRIAGPLCIANDSALIVDVLHSYYLRENAAELPQEGYFQVVRNHIDTNLHRMRLGSPERSKWEWMAGFFNDALTRHGISVPPFASLPLPQSD